MFKKRSRPDAATARPAEAIKSQTESSNVKNESDSTFSASTGPVASNPALKRQRLGDIVREKLEEKQNEQKRQEAEAKAEKEEEEKQKRLEKEQQKFGKLGLDHAQEGEILTLADDTGTSASGSQGLKNMALVSAKDSATRVYQIDSDKSNDQIAKYKRDQLLREKKEKGEISQNTYLGQGVRKEYIGKTESQLSKNKQTGQMGPVRGNTTIRSSTRFDFWGTSGDGGVCKEYKLYGFCGYGDSCIYLHDRSDYKSGWQLEQEYNEKKKKMEEKQMKRLEKLNKKSSRCKRVDGGNSDEDGESYQSESDSEESSDSDNIDTNIKVSIDKLGSGDPSNPHSNKQGASNKQMLQEVLKHAQQNKNSSSSSGTGTGSKGIKQNNPSDYGQTGDPDTLPKFCFLCKRDWDTLIDKHMISPVQLQPCYCVMCEECCLGHKISNEETSTSSSTTVTCFGKKICPCCKQSINGIMNNVEGKWEKQKKRIAEKKRLKKDQERGLI